MNKYKTKIGTVYTRTKADINGKEYYQLLDSDCAPLMDFTFETDLLAELEAIQNSETINNWLERFDGVCWAPTKKGVLKIAEDYFKSQYNNWDEDSIESSINNLYCNYANSLNHIGDTYVLFNYAEY